MVRHPGFLYGCSAGSAEGWSEGMTRTQDQAARASSSFLRRSSIRRTHQMLTS